MTFALGFIAIATLVAIFAPRFVTPEELGGEFGILVWLAAFVGIAALVLALVVVTLILLFVPASPSGLWLFPLGLLLAPGLPLLAAP